MKLKKKFVLSALVLAMGFHATSHAADSEASFENVDKEIEKMVIVGVRSSRVSKGATGLTMEINETPQSISVISSELIENYSANNINDALKLATGLNVEDWETNRTNYTSRGFNIKSTQIDGVGMPNGWGIVTGAMESYGYEKIEVVRGANGLLTGVGNAAGTLNYIRKRPTNENQGDIGLSVGSNNLKRLQADYSTLLTEDGRWAARVIAVAEDKTSHLDGLSNDRTYLYGVVDGQLTDNSTLAVGFSYQDANTDGNMWGGLVLNYTDGTQAEWDRSTSTAPEWSSWDTENTSAFVEYTYIFDNDWEIKTTYNKKIAKSASKLFYVYGAIDKKTGLGLTGSPGRYGADFNADLFNINVLGEYTLFGQDHEISLGVSTAQSNNLSTKHAPVPGRGPTPAFPYSMNAIPEPTWGEKNQYADIDMTLNRFFGSTKLNITNDFFIVAGFNAIDFTRKGRNYAININNDESEISPYIGTTYAITDDINAYVSYSDIYQPQEQYDYDGYFLDPTKGINVEAGIKTQWFDDNLLATLAVFTAEQKGLADYVGKNSSGKSYYKGITIESKGFELELIGQITDNLNMILGYTLINLENDTGKKVRKSTPKNTVNLSLDYTLSQVPELTFGLGGKWQSKIENTRYSIKQDSYLLLNAFARWNVTDQLKVQVNLNNLTDEKYITSLYHVSYYGAPVNGTVSLLYHF